jgi:DNA-binding SARP family transcriptional activator
VVEFERWVEAERGRRAREYSAALEALIAGAAARQDYLVAAQWGRRLAAAEPFNSRAAIGLIEALVAAGDRAGALQFATARGAASRVLASSARSSGSPERSATGTTSKLRRRASALAP